MLKNVNTFNIQYISEISRPQKRSNLSLFQVAEYFKNEATRLNLNTTEWDVSDMVWEIFEIDDRNKDGLISRREFSGPVKGSDEL